MLTVVPKNKTVKSLKHYYFISVYGTCNATQTVRLQKLLNFAARVVSGRRKFDHISDVLRDLEWLTAHNLHVFHALTLLKRMLFTSLPESLAVNLVQIAMYISAPRDKMTCYTYQPSDQNLGGDDFCIPL